MSVTIGNCSNEIAFPNKDWSVFCVFVLFLIFICLVFGISMNCLVWFDVYDYKFSYLYFTNVCLPAGGEKVLNLRETVFSLWHNAEYFI